MDCALSNCLPIFPSLRRWESPTTQKSLDVFDVLLLGIRRSWDGYPKGWRKEGWDSGWVRELWSKTMDLFGENGGSDGRIWVAHSQILPTAFWATFWKGFYVCVGSSHSSQNNVNILKIFPFVIG
jgi:hypothetical protein